MLTRIVAFLQSIVLVFSGLFVSAFNLPDEKTDALIEQNGGFIRGVCHPNENYDLLRNGGFTWVRIDVPYPYNADGSFTGAYRSFRERCRGYAERGFKVMAITPYPHSYIAAGLDPRKAENEKAIGEIAVALYEDLRDVCAAFQVTNEMGIDTFTYPLTLEEAARFIGVQLEALAPVTENFPIGYNSAGMNLTLHKLMKPYHAYCDYVGLDLYVGNDSESTARDYTKRIRRVYRATHLPIILEEFGFLSEGAPKTDAQRQAILASYGYASEEEAVADLDAFVAKLPPAFQQRLTESGRPREEWGDVIFRDYRGHFYCERGTKTYKNYGHTPEGQAQYYADLLPKLRRVSCLAGTIIYCCQDSGVCWFCGQKACPSETRWGLIDENGVPKPAFEAVRDCFTSESFS